MKLNEFNSNLIFIFPIVTGFITGIWMYVILSVSTFIASSLYHFNKGNNGRHTDIYRSLDIVIAILSYFYMFYFISAYITADHTPFYAALFVSLVLFFAGKYKNNNPRIHVYFHICVGTLSGVMPLFTN